jgi:hypothetical protein
MAPNVVSVQYPCGFQRNTIFHTTELQSVQRKNVASFVPAGYSPNLIKNVPFVPERQCLSGAIDKVDHQIVVPANSAWEHKALDSGGDEFVGKLHRRDQFIPIETGSPDGFDYLRRSKSGEVERFLKIDGDRIHNPRVLVDAYLAGTTEPRFACGDFLACLERNVPWNLAATEREPDSSRRLHTRKQI